MDKKRTVEVTFYRFQNGEKGVTKGITASITGAEVIHPTRITQEEWNEILNVPPQKVQEILSQFLKI